MRILGCEVVVDEKMPKTTAVLAPSRLPHPMSREEAARWMREHSVVIVDLAPPRDDTKRG